MCSVMFVFRFSNNFETGRVKSNLCLVYSYELHWAVLSRFNRFGVN